MNLGSKSTAIVNFDGTLQNKEKEDVEAYVADGKIELQQWWSASEKQEAEIADTISVTYTKVEVVYEYSAGELTSLQGDVNKDGQFDAADAQALQAYLLAAGTLADWSAGDYDGNGRLNAVDLTMMKRELLNA